MARTLIFDAWTPMSFKRVLGNRTQPGHSYEQPSWVGDHDRRLMAYKVLQAYLDNAAREFLATTDESKIEEHREYGDAALIRDTILAALLGEEQTVVVFGADEKGEDDQPAEGAVAKTALQDWLREQWINERGPLKQQELERDGVGLGDGVVTLGFDPEKGRVRMRIWDPGFYFPVLGDGNEDDFPEKVHVAWEIPEADRRDKNKAEIRRLTWELVRLEDGATRDYPWNEKSSSFTCLYTDATFQLENAAGTINNLTDATARYAEDADGEPIHDFDMNQDFLPVVHIPNTVALKDHYGRSSIATVLQILDDLANSDTDAQAASATAGRPVMALSGASLGKAAPTYNPGEVWETGEGAATWLDSSKNLDAVLKYIEFLLKRLSVNARTPDALLGRVDPSEVPSGLALALSFGPLGSMIVSMRLSRNEKYPLLLKFLWRMSVTNSVEGTPEAWFPSALELGSYMPQDKAGAVDMVSKLLTSTPPAVSLETGVKILMGAGFPIDEAEDEVAKIQSRDFAGAVQLRDAMPSDEAVAEYLGIDVPSDVEKPEPPQVVAPPPGGGVAPAAGTTTPPAPTP